jgi:hypothetical protein
MVKGVSPPRLVNAIFYTARLPWPIRGDVGERELKRRHYVDDRRGTRRAHPVRIAITSAARILARRRAAVIVVTLGPATNFGAGFDLLRAGRSPRSAPLDWPYARTVPYIRSTNLELNDLQAEVLIRELHSIIQNDRYPLSPRIVALKEILGMLRLERERPEPLPPFSPHSVDVVSDFCPFGERRSNPARRPPGAGYHQTWRASDMARIRHGAHRVPGIPASDIASDMSRQCHRTMLLE